MLSIRSFTYHIQPGALIAWNVIQIPMINGDLGLEITSGTLPYYSGGGGNSQTAKNPIDGGGPT